MTLNLRVGALINFYVQIHYFMSLKVCSVFLLLFVSKIGFSQQSKSSTERLVATINQSWQFSKDIHNKGEKLLKYQMVNIPHTWNAFDVLDDEPGYYRGVGYYKKKLNLQTVGIKICT